MKASHLKIAAMLYAQKRGHISFHTPGHKRQGTDITELSYSDNLYSPRGVLAEAEADVAEVLGAERSFLLTDGSTSGVYSMLAAAKAAGCKKIAFPVFSHVSVFHACSVLGLEEVRIPCFRKAGVPQQPQVEELATALKRADALLLTSPDYYGNLAPLKEARALCTAANKPLLIDGAHGGHLHFTEEYAGRYADLWVDGVHKSLPALTQGAVVSAAEGWGERLYESVRLFRTTSPSYPILASVEYAVKYPRNLKIEALARGYARALGAYENGDWSKLVLPFGREANAAEEALARRNIYPEFNDGNYLMFYLSPCTKERELKKLYKVLKGLPRGKAEEFSLPQGKGEGETEWVPLLSAEGRVCAAECGLFPPCLPLVNVGETFTQTAIGRLKSGNAFGLCEGKVLVFKEGNA